MSETIMLRDIRLAFPKIWRPEAFQGGSGDKRYQAAFPLEPHGVHSKAIEAAIQTVAVEQWKDKAALVVGELKKKDRICYTRTTKTNADGEAYEGFEDMWSLNSASPARARPLIINRDKTPLTEEDGIIYGGCYVEALIEIWAQVGQWGNRVNATLKALRFLRDGDAFGGGVPAKVDDFDDLADIDAAPFEPDENSLF